MVDEAPKAVPENLLHARYQIQQQLANPAGRQTLLATDLKTAKPVVIKLLTFDQSFEWDDLKLFEREANTLKTLSHPCIPRYLDFLEIESPDAKQLALVQTYISGRSLEDYLQAGRIFTEPEIKELLKSLLQILVYLHERQPPVIHRDIKPSNILLGDRSGNSIGQVHLVDFGSVQTLAIQEGRTVTVVGTYGYMPPEQFGGRTVPASDLYSVGATAIALATGKHPADLPQQDFRPHFEPFVQFTPAFTSWLQQMIEPRLDRRFSSAQSALQALEQLQQWHHANLVQHAKKAPPFDYTGNIIARSRALGSVSGLLCGALFGISIMPRVGSDPGIGAIFGAIVGLIAGLILGSVNGALLSRITARFFYPLKSVELYRWTARLLGTFLGSGGMVLYFLILKEGPITRTTSMIVGSSLGTAIILAGVIGAFIGQSLAQWYEQQARDEEDE